jgi:hypothetical protein
MRKYTVVRSKLERNLPDNLIDLLILQKLSIYDKEMRNKLLRQNDKDDWDRLEKDWDSSESDEDEQEAVNNFIWYYGADDPNNYFAMITRNNTFYEKDTQVLCCYGRSPNSHLMPAYGFCLANNKYNSLKFKVWIDFNQDEIVREEALKAKREAREAKLKAKIQAKKDKIAKKLA